MNRKPLWVTDPNYIRDKSQLYKLIEDSNQLKREAETRMAAYDKLPKVARRAINEYGQLRAAVYCTSRKAIDKCNAVRNAYQKKLNKTAVCI